MYRSSLVVLFFIFVGCSSKHDGEDPSEYTYKSTSRPVPWAMMSSCDIGVLLCKVSSSVKEDLETQVYCDALKRSIIESFDRDARTRYRTEDLSVTFRAIEAEGGLGKDGLGDVICSSFTPSIEARISRSQVEKVWRISEAARC